MVYVKLMRQMRKEKKKKNCTNQDRVLGGTMLKYCPTGERRGGNAAPASQVFCKFWVTGRHKKLCFFFFHFKSTINRKQSRVKYAKSAVKVAELFLSSLPNVTPSSSSLGSLNVCMSGKLE